MQQFIFRAGMLLYKHRHWRPVKRLTQQPATAQMNVLQRLLFQNRDTHFGKKHRFSEIHNYSQFQQNIPVQTYETLRLHIEEQRLTGANALTAESPKFYAQTSGTTGEPKYIPITPMTLKMHRDEQSLFSYLQYRACPEAFSGKALGIMGAAVEGHLDSGHEVGSVSGNLYQSLPRIIQSRFVLPPAVSRISNYDLKYLVILRLALAEPNITYAGSPNPSTFLRLLNVLNEQRELLTQSLATGKLTEIDSLDADLQNQLAHIFKPDPVRFVQLSKLSELTFANVWPNLKLLTTWTGGSCGIALTALREKLPPKTKVMELGYQSTEFRGSIALQAETSAGLPPLHHHFFEFVEQARWDNNDPEFLMLDQLTQGKIYYILVTNASGLYRYFMNDLVQVSGFFNATPLLSFVQKGKGVTNLTGEKLYEAQVISAVQAISSELGLISSFYILVANETTMSYQLFLEVNEPNSANNATLSSLLDEKLGELNIEYQSKRDSGRLAPPTTTWLRHGTAEAYKTSCMNLGQREGQFKPTVLQYLQNLNLPLADYAVK
ncbi:MAG: GH3 auxin-responsive promoter family protein [Methylotenera sp.]